MFLKFPTLGFLLSFLDDGVDEALASRVDLERGLFDDDDDGYGKRRPGRRYNDDDDDDDAEEEPEVLGAEVALGT